MLTLSHCVLHIFLYAVHLSYKGKREFWIAAVYKLDNRWSTWPPLPAPKLWCREHLRGGCVCIFPGRGGVSYPHAASERLSCAVWFKSCNQLLMVDSNLPPDLGNSASGNSTQHRPYLSKWVILFSYFCPFVGKLSSFLTPQNMCVLSVNDELCQLSRKA